MWKWSELQFKQGKWQLPEIEARILKADLIENFLDNLVILLCDRNGCINSLDMGSWARLHSLLCSESIFLTPFSGQNLSSTTFMCIKVYLIISFSFHKIKECSLYTGDNEAQLWEKWHVMNSNGLLQMLESHLLVESHKCNPNHVWTLRTHRHWIPVYITG